MSKRWRFTLAAWMLLFVPFAWGLYEYSLDPDCVPRSECERTMALLPAKVLGFELVVFLATTTSIVGLGYRDRRRHPRP
jgi:hypothetical protein